MTVRDAIQQLSALNPDAPLVIFDGITEMLNFGYRDARRLTTIQVAPRAASGFYPRFLNLTERNTVTAVCLE